MTAHGKVSRSVWSDVAELDLILRPEDRRELEGITGEPALRSLQRAVVMGAPALTLRTHEGSMIGILSVVPMGYLHGAIAFSGSTLIEGNRTAFLRGSREVLATLDSSFDTILNVCDARNEVHHRWLKWLGFTFIRKIDRFGAKGVPVYEFARIKP